MRDVLQEVDHPNGLYYNFISPHSKSWCQRKKIGFESRYPFTCIMSDNELFQLSTP